MTQCLIDFFKKQDVEYTESFNLSKISSIGIGGIAKFAVMPANSSSLIKTLNYLQKNKVSFKVLGRMTNTLMLDDLYEGVVVLTSKLTRYSLAENILSVECGALFSKVLFDVSHLGFGGCEELYGIPGSVGGMVCGNAGAYGRCISDFFIQGSFYSPSANKEFILDSESMAFSYRNSVMKETDYVLVSADFALSRDKPDLIKSKMHSYFSKRKDSQPYSELSLGSIFKRCGEIPISRLIDELGLKGFSVGGASVSKKHAGFIVNSGGATPSDVIALIGFIKNKIYDSYGITIEEEIQFF